MRQGLLLALCLIACHAPPPAPRTALPPVVSRTAFQELFDSVINQPGEGMRAYLNPFSDRTGVSRHDSTVLAGLLASGRFKGLCSWFGQAPRCAPMSGNQGEFILYVFAQDRRGDTLVVQTGMFMDPPPHYLFANRDRSIEFVPDGGGWRLLPHSGYWAFDN